MKRITILLLLIVLIASLIACTKENSKLLLLESYKNNSGDVTDSVHYDDDDYITVVYQLEVENRVDLNNISATYTNSPYLDNEDKSYADVYFQGSTSKHDNNNEAFYAFRGEKLNIVVTTCYPVGTFYGKEVEKAECTLTVSILYEGDTEPTIYTKDFLIDKDGKVKD